MYDMNHIHNITNKACPPQERSFGYMAVLTDTNIGLATSRDASNIFLS